MPRSDQVIVVETGAANIASVCAALIRSGANPHLSSALSEIKAARRLVLPGVGAFGSVMERLHELGLVKELRQRIQSGRSTLAICLGMQVLAKASEESPGVQGLGILDQTVTRFDWKLRVPQLGWNQVNTGSECSLLCDGPAYFANSFRLQAIPVGWNGAIADHGGSFVAALERGSVLACQFHPELSGNWGKNLITRWLSSDVVAPC